MTVRRALVKQEGTFGHLANIYRKPIHSLLLTRASCRPFIPTSIQVSGMDESPETASADRTKGESNYTVVEWKNTNEEGERKSRRQPSPAARPRRLSSSCSSEPCGGKDAFGFFPSSGVYTTTIHQRAPEMPNPDVHNDDTS